MVLDVAVIQKYMMSALKEFVRWAEDAHRIRRNIVALLCLLIPPTKFGLYQSSAIACTQILTSIGEMLVPC